ncbi:ribosome small subunit-dependent GTPase A [Cyanobium sp. T1B-Tous]|uniref:ribosome small subunit-dependent GTPase A n=1 Tax=Cyanobium sp. T1B-Tous TaxID=2823721 RepID=UPI0020CEADA1|nr:ribosome small subunit-dependent GTPase A [Cyanobium sp. T1B-Tous]MCP9806307.1 ribosome small subunit-dependent GTPase A [Cyanobium sp. T1B-Tous]
MSAEAGRLRLPGQVVALLANYCWVELDRPGPTGLSRLLCTRRTRLGKSGQSIAVGDRVWVDGIDWPEGRGAVAALEPRDGLLERPAVANVARVVVVVALAEPELDPLQLTRFLLTAEATGRPVQLVFSKADLVPAPLAQDWCERAAAWGYEALAVSTHTGQGLERLHQRLVQPGIAVLCGPSGVGKSSVLNGLCPELGLRVAAVSGRLQRGRHTTRHVELFPLAPGALLADTPGFNRPSLPAEPAGLADLFPEIRERLSRGSCRFSNCLHQGDPGCAVGADWERHGLYLQCLADVVLDAERRARASSRAEGPGLRRRGQGLEPRLAPQLRQPSRRRQRQQLLDGDTGDDSGRDTGGAFSPPDPAG